MIQNSTKLHQNQHLPLKTEGNSRVPIQTEGSGEGRTLGEPGGTDETQPPWRMTQRWPRAIRES